MFLQVPPSFWPEFFHVYGRSILMSLITTVVSFVFGRWWGNRQARREWAKKEFFDRINVSLNSFGEGKLKIRTIMERSLGEIFTNKIAAERVLAASQKTTVGNAMLPIAKEDCWYLLNFVLNAVAEHFSTGLIRQDAGEPVKTVTYLICLTCEVVGDERIRKVRAMMVRHELLQDFPYKDKLPVLENPWHETRIHTLRKAAEFYQTNPEQFIKFEVCV